MSAAATTSTSTSFAGIDTSEYQQQPGAEMAHPDAMGVLTDEQLLMKDPRLQDAISQLENNDRFSQEAIQQRLDDRRKEREAAGLATVPAASSGEAVPDVIAFGFCKLVFEYLQALKTRFPKRKMICKTWESFWPIVERAPSMPYEKFRQLLDAIGDEMLERAVQSDESVASRVEKLRARMQKTDDDGEPVKGAKEAREEFDQLKWQHGLDLFERRQSARKALPEKPADVSAADNQALFDEYEVIVLRHLMKVPLFRLAKLDKVWCTRLDLHTRDCNMAYAERLCNVTRLINGFDDDLKRLINSISIDSLKSVQGRKKRQIDINELLDELQQRILGDDDFLDKVTEIAMKQAV